MEDRIENELERLGCEPKWRGRYWVVKCPKHADRSPSAQCFPDGWINCMAGCGRFHINTLGNNIVPFKRESEEVRYEREKKEAIKRGDFTDVWLDLDALEDDVKGIPAKVLNQLGWRKYEGGNGYMPGTFIPYFDVTGKKVPFFQIRHSEESKRRFTFVKDITPICYGFECLPKMKKYLCFTEGSRDSVILRMCGIPAIALPSASSNKLITGLANYADAHKLKVVAICDRDEAGEMLVKALQTASKAFYDRRTPVGKDVGDFYAQKGLESVKAYYQRYITQEGLVTR